MSEAAPDWKKLIAGAIKQDPISVNQLLTETQRPLFQYCFHLTHNRQLAEDLTHDAFLKALGSIKQLKEPSSFVAWIKTIARMLYLDFLKSSAQSRPHVPVEDLENESSLGVESGDRTDQIHAGRVLQKLSEEDRTILILIDIQECSYAEVALMLQVPEGTVKSRLSRARDKFSELFNGTNLEAQSSSISRARAKI